MVFFVAFFFATLAPTANVVMLIGTIMAERFLNLCSIGSTGCVVIAVYAACRRLPAKATPAVLTLIGIAFAARTLMRNFDCCDGKTLWASAVVASPASFKTHASLANPALYPNATSLATTVREIDRALAILEPPAQRALLSRPRISLVISNESLLLAGVWTASQCGRDRILPEARRSCRSDV